MATIQIRDVSEDAYETIRRRARSADMSIQAYMKEQVERLADEPTGEELRAQLEAHLDRHGIELDRATLLDDLDADRR